MKKKNINVFRNHIADTKKNLLTLSLFLSVIFLSKKKKNPHPRDIEIREKNPHGEFLRDREIRKKIPMGNFWEIEKFGEKKIPMGNF